MSSRHRTSRRSPRSITMLDRALYLARRLALADARAEAEAQNAKRKHATATAPVRDELEGLTAALMQKLAPDAVEPMPAVQSIGRRSPPTARPRLKAAGVGAAPILRVLIALADLGGRATAADVAARVGVSAADIAALLRAAQAARGAIYDGSAYVLADGGEPVTTTVGTSRTPRQERCSLGGLLLTALLEIERVRLDTLAERIRAQTGVRVSRASLSQWRLGHAAPHRETAAALERILGIPAGAWKRPIYLVAGAARPSAPLVAVPAPPPGGAPEMPALMVALREAPEGRATVAALAMTTGMAESRVRESLGRASDLGLVRRGPGLDEHETVRSPQR